MKNILAIAAVTVTLSGIAAYAVQPENVGTVNITVLDENGKLVSDAQAAGMSGEALADAVIPRLRDRYSRWNGFDDSARPNILQTDAELRGKKRIPQADSTR